ncbi:hypothetical protein [uncultured Thiodictyon sp.]|uniref:hypothetical protein n=1 Tax=uncultured Thiodictyon sp. TaxID=1846217 RepID=UPI0025EA4064|nr:hypothetical protein [uncultured Thiodictyon sp.]
MRPPFSLVALLLLTAGCVPFNQRVDSPVPSVVNPAPANLIPTLVTDASTQLEILYPAPSTPVGLAAQPADTFGQGLVAALIAKGYHVTVGSARTAPAGYALSYFIDVPTGVPAGLEVYRVTVFVGSTSISRAYLPDPSGAVPAGPWSQRQ